MVEQEATVGAASSVPFDQLVSMIGTPTGTTVVRIERAPVEAFADAVFDDCPEYRHPAAATAAGFDAIPVPPTFPIAMTHWGAFAELQEGPPEAGVGSGREAVIALLGEGGLRLHGEQDFEYHRPMVVGDVLVGTGRIVDVYRKETPQLSMTFIVSEIVWRDQATGEPVLTATRSLVWIPS
jgi:hypothetical protein